MLYPDLPLSTLLTLSLVPYRELWDPGRKGLGDEVLYRATEDALASLPPLRGRWRLAWGPSRYDPRFSLFDDFLMFVAQDQEQPSRHVFVVRAANPRSLFDWLLGDPWVTRAVAWGRGGTPSRSERRRAPRISLSAALGLSILRNLRSHPLPTDPLTRVWRRLEDGAGEKVRRSGKRVATLLRGRGGRGLREIQAPVREDVREIPHTQKRRREQGAADYLSWLASRPKRRSGPLMRRLLDERATYGPARAFDLLAFLEGNAHLRHRVDPGVGSLSFLEQTLARHDTVDIVVTGHGKGGTLALLFASWLLDARLGHEGAAGAGWDPEGRSTVRCVTFGAPPAGDEAFAAYAEQAFDGRLVQVVGERDVVPVAWTADGAASVPGFYAPCPPPAGLEAVARQLEADLGPLRYSRVSSAELRLPGRTDPGLDTYFQHAAFQHLEAYLENDRVGVAGAFAVRELFGRPQCADDSSERPRE